MWISSMLWQAFFMASFQRKQGDMMAGIGPEEQVVFRAMRRYQIMFGGGRGPLENVSKFGQKPSKQRLKEARRLPGGLRRLTTARPPAGGQERPERMGTSGSTSASKHYSKKCGYRSNPLSVDTNTYLLFFYFLIYNYRSKFKIYMNLICIC